MSDRASTRYRQCHLERKAGETVWKTNAWLPTQFCEVGKVVRLDEVDGWSVCRVGTVEVAHSYVVERSYRNAAPSLGQ